MAPLRSPEFAWTVFGGGVEERSFAQSSGARRTNRADQQYRPGSIRDTAPPHKLPQASHPAQSEPRHPSV